MRTKDSPCRAGGTLPICRPRKTTDNANPNLSAITPVATKEASPEPERALPESASPGPEPASTGPGQSELQATIEPTTPKQPDRFTIHPLAEKFPTMSEKDFEELKESIRNYRLFDPIIVNGEYQILDGRHRHKACRELGIATVFKHRRDKASEEQFIYDSNIHRRHLTDDQRVMLAATFAPYFRKEGEGRKAARLQKPDEPSHSQKSVDPKSGPLKKRDIKSKKANSTVGKVTAKAGVSIHKAEQAIMVEENAPELSSAGESGELPLKDAAKEADVRAKRKGKPKEVFNSGIKPHSTRSVSKETTFEVFVLGLFKGVMADVNQEYPDKTREDVIKVICSQSRMSLS